MEKCKEHCTYSKAMKQPIPRLCVVCGHPEKYPEEAVCPIAPKVSWADYENVTHTPLPVSNLNYADRNSTDN